MTLLRILLSVSFLCPSISCASGLDHLFSKLGAESNHTDPGSYKDQAVGHYTLGGMAVRQRNRTIQPFNIRLPSLLAGGSCGNMDMRFGGFSFISGQEAREAIKRLGKGIPIYAWNLAMKTVAPQIMGELQWLDNKLQEINNMTLDDCRMRQAMFDAVLPKQGAMRETLCQEIEVSGGKDDFFGAMSKCRSGDAQAAHKDKKGKDGYEDLLSGEYNLVWKVLQRLPQYKDNKEIAEFIMGMVGTVISRRSTKEKGKKNENKSSAYELHTIPPLADELNFISAHLDGGKISRLVCNDKEMCLKPTETALEIKYEAAMTNRVIKVVNSLQIKYLSGQAITDEEKSILGDAYSVPLFKYIQVSAAANSNVILMKDAARFIAISLLLTQFDTIAAEILRAAETLESIQIDSSALEKFKKNLHLARTRLQSMINKTDYEGIWRLNQHIKSLENIIEASTDS